MRGLVHDRRHADVQFYPSDHRARQCVLRGEQRVQRPPKWFEHHHRQLRPIGRLTVRARAAVAAAAAAVEATETAAPFAAATAFAAVAATAFATSFAFATATFATGVATAFATSFATATFTTCVAAAVSTSTPTAGHAHGGVRRLVRLAHLAAHVDGSHHHARL
jgi:hypothetical protein